MNERQIYSQLSFAKNISTLHIAQLRSEIIRMYYKAFLESRLLKIVQVRFLAARGHCKAVKIKIQK
jgi:hypothetical protein